MNALITAIKILTVLPVKGKETENVSDSLVWFPLVGGIVGLVTVLVIIVVKAFTGWTVGAGILAIIMMVLLTGGLHLDGLADMFDSLGAQSANLWKLRCCLAWPVQSGS